MARLGVPGSDTTPRPPPAATRLEFEQRLRVSDRERLFFAEGRNATVAVVGGARMRTLLSNGHPEASDAGDMWTQIGVAVVPLALHPAPRDVLVVGLASGVTADAAARRPESSASTSRTSRPRWPGPPRASPT